MPGQTPTTMHGGVVVEPHHPASMEGRAIARPNLRCSTKPNGYWPSQVLASMEGRAIARPNVLRWWLRPTPDRCTPGFNGGPGNCPAKPFRLPRQGPASPESHLASMEGRAIARPNPTPSVSAAWYNDVADVSFNGGPGNCPAKLPKIVVSATKALMGSASMEGRAIARPNRTYRQLFLPADRHAASMEGRAIARPNSTCGATVMTTRHRDARASMEGRAIARPNLRDLLDAGNVYDVHRASMEGRAIARPNPSGHRRWPVRPHDLASMEGRAIARPNNPSRGARPQSARVFVLQWRAGQLPGQTLGSTTGKVRVSIQASMEGPGNCPAKHPPRELAIDLTRAIEASMEGRAIARPNR